MKINTTKIKSIFKRSLFGDFDGDGVMNAFDCQPKNKRKQDTYRNTVNALRERARAEEMRREDEIDKILGDKDD